MKVLNQLIEHFWTRGALTLDQAHYLVEHGFVRSRDLENYEPRPDPETGDDTELEEPAEREKPWEHGWDDTPAQTIEMEEVQEAIEIRPTGGRSGKSAVPEYDLADLQRDLAAALEAREAYFPALIELANRVKPCHDVQRAAISLRQTALELKRNEFVQAARIRPGILADVWECVHDEPFHALAERPLRGRVIRDFGILLRSPEPGRWGSAAWLLKADEVQAAMNLLAIRKPILAAIAAMHDYHWGLLSRCVQRPNPQGNGWKSLAYGLVVLHHARAGHRTPPGYPLPFANDDPIWDEAWTVAMAMDAAAVTPFLMRRPVPAQSSEAEMTEANGLTCPYEWKV